MNVGSLLFFFTILYFDNIHKVSAGKDISFYSIRLHLSDSFSDLEIQNGQSDYNIIGYLITQHNMK